MGGACPDLTRSVADVLPDPIPLSTPDVRERVLGRLGRATMG